MDRELIDGLLVLVLPMVIGLALPKLVRRPLTPISTVIFVMSLFGQGVHDDHFTIYLCNLTFLMGAIVRECVDPVVRIVRGRRRGQARG
jgi:hypothetical protein